MKKTEKQTFAASRAHVWLRCSASEKNQKKGKNPFQQRNAQADEGTLIHARAARMLGKDVPETTAEYQLFTNPDSDAQSVVDFYVDAVKRHENQELMGEYQSELYIEEDFSFHSKKVLYRVIPDAAIYKRVEIEADTLSDRIEILTVFDLKTGFVPVSAEDNEQLIIAAHGICRRQNIRPQKITGIIVSPRLSSIEYADIQYDPDFFDKLDRELTERKGRFVPGAHCKKCNILTKCKKFKETLEQYLDPSIKDGLTSKPEEWARTLAISGPARKFFEDLESEAKEFLELGGTIPDFALRRTGGKRQWFRELEPAFIAEKLAIKETELFEKPKLITVAQAEKKLAKTERDKLNALIYQPQNVSLTVANERTFLSREGEKLIRVDTGLDKILKTKGKQNGKSERKGKRK